MGLLSYLSSYKNVICCSFKTLSFGPGMMLNTCQIVYWMQCSDNAFLLFMPHLILWTSYFKFKYPTLLLPFQVTLLSSEEETRKLCSAPCFSSYKFCNNIESAECDHCHKEMDLNKYPFKVIHVKGLTKRFCSQVHHEFRQFYQHLEQTGLNIETCTTKKLGVKFVAKLGL
jgi:hypothetical protein